MPLALPALLLAPLVVLIAYAALAISGFGSALISIPLLALLFPVKIVIPLVLIVDFVATLATGMRFRRDVSLEEIKPVVPPMLVGLVAGVTLLVQLPGRWILLALGLFILGNGAYSLVWHRRARLIARWWAIPAGFVGGLLGGVFGVGGPVYVIYLSGRIGDPARLRATLSTLFTVSTAARLALFLFSGLLLQRAVWLAALYLLPFMALGLFAGHKIHVKLTRAQIGKLVSLLLLSAGMSVLWKAWTTA
jgi:uncharacterized protein